MVEKTTHSFTLRFSRFPKVYHGTRAQSKCSLRATLVVHFTVKDSVIEKTGTIELILAMIDIDLESSKSN